MPFIFFGLLAIMLIAGAEGAHLASKPKEKPAEPSAPPPGTFRRIAASPGAATKPSGVAAIKVTRVLSPAEATGAAKLLQLLVAIAKKKSGILDKPAAVVLATGLGLKQTAGTVAAGLGLPDGELWPGTNASVAAYVKSQMG